MRLADLTLDTVTKAVSLYLELAYGSGERPRKMPNFDLAADSVPEQILGLFQRDVVEESGGQCTRYTMRLGNRNYPFMKLLLQEHIVEGEYFFGVDTHDEMEIKPDFPDYEQWLAVRRFNQELKRQIEARFTLEDLDTANTIKNLCAQRSAREEPRRGSILIVDDEEDLAEAVETLLRLQGYEMHTAHDGREAVEQAQALQPDMLLLDYELPEMDGLEVIAALRKDPATRSIPILLCTASRISVGDIGKADGFLAKPYQEQLLYEMVQRVMASSRESQS